MSAHTPGPWLVTDILRGKYAGATGIYPADLMAPAFAILPAGCAHIQRANARLLRGAPEMLAALRVVSGCVPDSQGGTTLGSYEMGVVRAALAKVEA